MINEVQKYFYLQQTKFTIQNRQIFYNNQLINNFYL